MSKAHKGIVSYIIRFFFTIGLLFLFTDMVGILFVGENFVVRAEFRYKLLLFLTAFSVGYLASIRLFPMRKLICIGYPLYIAILFLCGVLTASHHYMGYKIGLLLAPLVAHILNRYGKKLLRNYLLLISRLAGGRLFGRKGLICIGATCTIAMLLVFGVYSLRGTCHFHLHEFIVENVVPVKPVKPNYNPELKDRRDPYRNYHHIFSDLNDTQLEAARANGTPHVLTIEELTVGKYGLKHIESNKLYKVDPLTHSAPYLVPKAKDFLDDLGEAFQDSLYNRGYDRRHRFIVTSVYRTQDHIKRLRRSGNVNASQNSCHQYGTTIDITYVRFDKPEEHQANDPKLLQLLMQTVYDMHKAGRCYVKYERKQSCLHITVR